MAAQRGDNNRLQNTSSTMDLWGQCSRAQQRLDEAVGGVLKMEKELRQNATEVRGQVQSLMSRQQEALRCRELWLLQQIEILEQIKSETFQQQLLQMNWLTAQLDLISDQLQKQPISNELKNHLTNQLSSVLDSLSTLSLTPEETPDLCFHGDTRSLRTAITSFGAVTSSAHTPAHSPAPKRQKTEGALSQWLLGAEAQSVAPGYQSSEPRDWLVMSQSQNPVSVQTQFDVFSAWEGQLLNLEAWLLKEITPLTSNPAHYNGLSNRGRSISCSTSSSFEEIDQSELSADELDQSEALELWGAVLRPFEERWDSSDWLLPRGDCLSCKRPTQTLEIENRGPVPLSLVFLSVELRCPRKSAEMQRALFRRSAQLAQQSLDGCLVRSAPLVQRQERQMSSVTMPPPACLLRPLEAPLRHLFGPGPSNVPPRILAAGGRPIIGHLHPEMYEIMNDIKKGIQYAFQTENNMTIAMSGSGHAAMECAVFNTVEPGENVLVAINGIWGERVAEIAERMGANVHRMEKSPGGYFSNKEIEQVIEKHKPVLFFLTHGESSAGLCHPVDGIGDICRKHDCLFLVDTVASLGAAPIFMDQQNIDILYTGSQKALNAPPGTAPISFNERACQKMFNRKTKPVSYLFDMTHLSNYWGCDGKPARVYHHTGPVSGFFALRESLAILSEMGLEASWKKHKEVAAYLYRGLEDLGLKLFIPDRDLRLPSVTTISIPEGYDWRELLMYMMKNHQIEMTGGLGPSIGMVMRIGLMGYNCEKHKADMALHALADALKNCKKSKA